jgi:hypothetical protein
MTACNTRWLRPHNAKPFIGANDLTVLTRRKATCIQSVSQSVNQSVNLIWINSYSMLVSNGSQMFDLNKRINNMSTDATQLNWPFEWPVELS